MNAQELYDYITKQLTPEEALKKLLESSILSYEKLKFNSQEDAVHPIIIISMCAMEMGWVMCIKKDEENVSGIVVGTQEYVDEIFKSCN